MSDEWDWVKKLEKWANGNYGFELTREGATSVVSKWGFSDPVLLLTPTLYRIPNLSPNKWKSGSLKMFNLKTSMDKEINSFNPFLFEVKVAY